ncbi:zona pellucida-binding protein 1 [Gracilinanus agilis]|uniref:zona pellucida-binding protein 1 n=1 Tax=Gracilinanus agilis TaxID=191870 RepID=UPI001CFE7185|nr:zona pellucida-binding protein 1 [Gracilinanus agilis]
MENAPRVWLWRDREYGSQFFPPFSLLLFFLLLQKPPSIGYPYSERSSRQTTGNTDIVKVVGSTDTPVKIYVMVNHVSPHLLCINKRLRNLELIDPVFHWIGPSGKTISENSYLKITTTGSLIFYNFKKDMSGVYTCSLSYKLTVEDMEKTVQLKYTIYAYIASNFYYEFTARYHSAPCHNIYNTAFEKKLLQILSKLIADLSCEVTLVKSECHHVKMQRAGIQNELFFTFSVIAIEKGTKGTDACTDSSCEPTKRLNKAQNLIKRFFVHQVEVLEKRSEPLPEIYFIEGTLQMVGIDRCNPGYGINALTHPDCADCCVICAPGTFNPRIGIHCLQCNRSHAFGATKC